VIGFVLSQARQQQKIEGYMQEASLLLSFLMVADN